MNLNESRVRIYNLALTKLGVTERLTTYSDDTVEAGAFNAVWEQVLHEVLELGEWRCARRRVTLERDTDSIEGASQEEPVVITATAHTFLEGDLVKITDVAGMTELNDNTYMVRNVDTDDFELWDENGTVELDGSAFAAYVSGGTIWRVPNWNYAYMFKLPDDCMKVIEIESGETDWVEENNFLLTNYENDKLSILYIAYISDPTKFSPLLADCVATRLAGVCCMALSKSLEKQRVLDAEFAAILSLARGQDARWRSTPDAASTLITEV
ncbi:MAG: hypothetical protein MUF84_11700 [Anaerolineae bacterium]|jgi:hypothetical protein|nr:hypothetical protein [Anaerolineae bacterium]